MSEYIDREKIMLKTCSDCTRQVNLVCKHTEPCEKLIAAFLCEEQEDVATIMSAKQREVIMTKWIRTKEKLPNCNPGTENPNPVLYALRKTGTVRIGYYGEMGTYRDKYFREYHDTTEGTDVDDVSHWMFAPEAPENDE